MKGEKNHFRKGLFMSLGLHLLIICLLALGVGGHGEVSPESSIEVSLSTHSPRVKKKKSAVKPPSRPQKAEKSAKKKVKKAPPKQAKPPKKKKEPPAAPVAKKQKPPEKPKEPRKETTAEKTAQKTEPKTRKEAPPIEKDSLESGKKEVIRNIKKETVLSSIEKSAAQASVEPAPKEPGPGVISLVLDVYYRTISKRIQRSLILPLNIDSGILLAAQVNFYMRETGEVYDVGIERSSGNLKFDSYCIKAVNDASPLPPPPSELRGRIKSEFFVISCESKQ